MLDKFLIIGASGFVGKNVVKYLKSLNLDSDQINTINGKDDIDLTNYESLNSRIKEVKPTKVINCASFVGGIAYGYKFPAKILHQNSSIVLNLYKSCEENKILMLINPISNCAYPGDLSFYEEQSFWNGKPHESVFDYALTRRLIVALGNSYYKEYGFSSTNVVLSNMYGPGDHFDEERSHALGALINKIYNAKKNNLNSIEIWGSGDPIREWLYVKDGAMALVKATQLSSGNHFFNIGVNKGISVTDLAIKIANAFSWKGEFIYDLSKPDGAKEKRVNGKIGSEMLNWTPQTTLDAGLQETVEWYLENIAK